MNTAPRLNAFTVAEFTAEDGKPAKAWTRIGVAFANKNGPGYSIRLNALPLNGNLVLLPPDTEEEDEVREETVAPAAAPRSTRRR